MFSGFGTINARVMIWYATPSTFYFEVFRHFLGFGMTLNMMI
uniref:Uncharacterized protein n=1 Tax=Rhizophora mucronata TaxID=61149 RepID=A0A2P2NVZ2_RHIMU